MVKICQTGLQKLNFEILPKKRIFRFLPKISAGHGWSWKKFFANFQILGPLGCQGWVVIPQIVKKKSKPLHPTAESGYPLFCEKMMFQNFYFFFSQYEVAGLHISLLLQQFSLRHSLAKNGLLNCSKVQYLTYINLMADWNWSKGARRPTPRIWYTARLYSMNAHW